MSGGNENLRPGQALSSGAVEAALRYLIEAVLGKAHK